MAKGGALLASVVLNASSREADLARSLSSEGKHWRRQSMIRKYGNRRATRGGLAGLGIGTAGGAAVAHRMQAGNGISKGDTMGGVLVKVSKADPERVGAAVGMAARRAKGALRRNGPGAGALVGIGAAGGAATQRRVSKAESIPFTPVRRIQPRDPGGRFASHGLDFTHHTGRGLTTRRAQLTVGHGKSGLAPTRTGRMRDRSSNGKIPNGSAVGHRLA